MREPKYRKHSNRDYAIVEWQGKRHRLPGKYGSRESRLAYAEFLQAYVYSDTSHPSSSASGAVWLIELASLYLDYARERYKGKRSEFENVRAALIHLVDVFPALAAADFGPKKLKVYQSHLANVTDHKGRRNSRNYVNSQISKVRRMFKWAVSEELVPPGVYEALKTVEPIKPGESPAVETKPREHAPWEHVEPVLQFMSPTLRAMVLLHWHTGVRSQNVVELRPGDVDTTKNPAEWRPPRHKNLYRGKQMLVFVGPRSMALIEPFLDRDPNTPCFSPRESYGWHLAEKAAARRSKRTPSQARKGVGQHVRDAYDSHTYQRAVEFAIRRCNKDRVAMGLEEIPKWTPHQLRHAKGTAVRAEYDLETAQAVLGHATLDATQIYAQQNLDRARRVALERG